jgi:hypothetical protein
MVHLLRNIHSPLQLALLFGLAMGCSSSDHGAEKTRPPQRTKNKGSDAKSAQRANSGQSTDNLELLLRPHSQWSRTLGAHRYRAKATVTQSSAGKEKKTVVVEADVLVDEKGNYSGAKNTSSQFGQEVIWVDGWLYVRRRHSRFLRRRPKGAEAKKKLNQLAGALPAYLKLLRPHIELNSSSSFIRRASPLKATGTSTLAHRWRRSIRLQAVEGGVKFDASSRIPLNTKLKASWDHLLPQAGDHDNGLPPIVTDGRRGQMVIDFEQSITLLKDPPQISAPVAEDVLYNARRQRLEVERQMLLGERKIPKNWRKVPKIPPKDETRGP